MEITWRGGKLELDTRSAVVCAIVCVSTAGLCQVAIAVRCAWLGVINAAIVVFIVVQALEGFPPRKVADS